MSKVEGLVDETYNRTVVQLYSDTTVKPNDRTAVQLELYNRTTVQPYAQVSVGQKPNLSEVS